VPGPEGSLGKLAAARVLTRTAELALRILGPDAMLDGTDAPAGGAWHHLFLAAPAVHIAGGTDEVQRNIISEQFLGLPRDEHPDRHLPFREVAAGTGTASGARGG
jgi:alkylation response protein AidB-like acyl-CoA dehydrogenase